MCVAAAQQHSSRIYRNKNDPENREALSSRSFACKTAWIIQNEIEFESRRGHESSVRFFLFFFFFLLFFWFRIDWKMIRPTCATTPSCVNTGNINSARFYRGVEFRQVDIRKKKKKKKRKYWNIRGKFASSLKLSSIKVYRSEWESWRTSSIEKEIFPYPRIVLYCIEFIKKKKSYEYIIIIHIINNLALTCNYSFRNSKNSIPNKI